MPKLKGPHGYLLVGADASPATALVSITSGVTATMLVQSGLVWHDAGRATDVDGNFTDNKSDVTDRVAARNFWQAEDNISRKGELTFTLLNHTDDKIAQLLIKAWNTQTLVSLLDLDQNPANATDAAPVKGFGGLFSLGMRTTKPIGGVQAFQVTASVVDYPNWHEFDQADGQTLAQKTYDVDGTALAVA